MAEFAADDFAAIAANLARIRKEEGKGEGQPATPPATPPALQPTTEAPIAVSRHDDSWFWMAEA